MISPFTWIKANVTSKLRVDTEKEQRENTKNFFKLQKKSEATIGCKNEILIKAIVNKNNSIFYHDRKASKTVI